MLLLRRSWLDRPLVGEVSLRRDFAGFDLPSLATGTLLPLDLVASVTGAPAPGPAGVDREREFAAAVAALAEWTRYAQEAPG